MNRRNNRNEGVCIAEGEEETLPKSEVYLDDPNLISKKGASILDDATTVQAHAHTSAMPEVSNLNEEEMKIN